ncbi:glycosyltransferase [Microbacterium paludicola]|uniref:glycosyltransferase n=1 Tax=Microbacterium paludicola TaxID=300019 RepID=UPI0031E32E87
MPHNTGPFTDSPATILIGADTFFPDVNGASRFTQDHAVRLARRGHDVHVVAPATNTRSLSRTEVFDGQQITVHRLRSVKWPLHDWLRVTPPWEVRAQARRILLNLAPAVVHLQSFIDIGRGLAYEAHKLGVPIVATNHVMPDNIVEFSGLPERFHPRLTKYGWNLATKVYSKADIVTSPTATAARYLEAQTSLLDVIPVSCGIDVDRFTPKQTRPVENRVLFVGRLDPEKNLATLLTAFSLIPTELHARLDIVGSGSERSRLQEHAQALGITDKVTFYGYVGDDRLIEMHHRATVFVMPSTAELQSIATLEAMASGTPVVLADAMALPHLVTPGHEGYLVHPRNAHEFADRIERLLRLEPEMYMRMSEAALATARAHDALAVTTQYEQLYRQTWTPAA